MRFLKPINSPSCLSFWEQSLCYSNGTMKCPHCDTGIAEALTTTQVINCPPVNTSKGFTPYIMWNMRHQVCPECNESIIYLNRERTDQVRPLSLRAYPVSKSRPVPAEVIEPYRQDFIEASKVLEDRPKASAALSRRNLQAILRDRAATKSRDLFDQIEEVITSSKVPAHIAEDLHAVRNIGNFAAHTIKSTATGAIVDVEPGEAEWNLDVLESLFDFYFVQPALSAKRKAYLNKKLKDAGKPELS
jgi:hypothetical protein